MYFKVDGKLDGTPSYEVHSSGDIGTMILYGIVFPRRNYDPLGKIWASVRKNVQKEFGIDIVGLFAYDDMKEIVSCTFILNYAYLQKVKVGQQTYLAIFEDNIELIINRFYGLILFFLSDGEEGYDKYVSLHEEEASNEDIDRSFNRFLESISLREDKRP